MVLGHDRGLAIQSRPGGRLGVDGIGLAALTTHLAVRSVHLHDLDAVGLEVTGETGAVGTSALDADLHEGAEAPEPARQRRVALGVGVKGRRVEDLSSFVHDGCYVDVLVGVNSAEHAEWFF